jgi:hypothetical protein
MSDEIEAFAEWTNTYLVAEGEQNTVRSVHYHLTDKRGLEGILRSEEVRFTDFRYLNDTAELMQGVKLAIGAFAAMDKAKNDGRLKLLFDLTADLLTNDNLGRFLTAFIASFSKNVIDVGVWRSYADDGRGFAIGFAPHFFNDQRPDADKPGRHAFSGRVSYPRSKRAPRLVRPIEHTATFFQQAVDRHAAEMAADKLAGIEVIREFANYLIAGPLIWNCLTTKHPGFRTERELRLILLGNPEYLAPVTRHRTRDGVEVPYIPYPFDRKVDVAKVVIGPAAPAGTRKFVRELLRDLGMPARISQSNIPYRSFARRA